VASDVPGLRDAVKHEETGLLVPYGEVPALAGAIRRLLGDPDLRGRYAEAAIRWANEFRWERSAEETVRWLEEVIAEGRESSRE
jgi:glycosyltransferase involved in cell wall biosynthesis